MNIIDYIAAFFTCILLYVLGISHGWSIKKQKEGEYFPAEFWEKLFDPNGEYQKELERSSIYTSINKFRKPYTPIASIESIAEHPDRKDFKIFTLKDISGIPHAISADVIEAALMKGDITLFDLKISEIAKLRQERNEECGEPTGLSITERVDGDIDFRVRIIQAGEYRIYYNHQLKRVSIMRMPIV